MKKTITALSIIALIALLAFFYLRIGIKAGETGAQVIGQSQGTIDQAKQSMDALNKSAEETKKALDEIGK